MHDAVELMRNGLTNYWTKPFDIESAVAEIQNCFEESPTQLGDAQYMLGQSAPVVQARKMLARLADKPVSVLITGESGVGKEEAVRFLASCMAKKTNIIAVNCAAMPDNLIESELFGHEKGAFTGAHEQKTGLIEQANGGILFLDEVGELPLHAQVKLLRVLQERMLRRIAGNKDIPVDFRLICATNRDLLQMVKSGDFREDLYYRINVINVHLPPLRARAGDVLLLANALLEKIALRMQMPVPGLSSGSERALMAFHFPGNVRELMNRLERAVALADGALLEACDLFPERSSFEDTATQSAATLKDIVQIAERDAIVQALAQADGVITTAAEHLGISRKNLWEKARRLSIALHDKGHSE